MNVIHSVEVVGMRGRKDSLAITFHPTVNFFIGRNGSGKTTLINLINSALAVDIGTLSSIAFRSIRITLRAKRTNKRPVIEVSKSEPKQAQVALIKYSIRQQTSASSDEFAVPVLTEREVPNAWSLQLGASHRPDPHSGTVGLIRSALDGLVNTTWLSVHRSSAIKSNAFEERYDFPIDKRLARVARDFGTYFSELDKRAAAETNNFQQTYFLSLVSPPKSHAISDLIKQIDADQEYDAIDAIFSEFGLRQSQYVPKIEAFRRKVRRVKDQYLPKTSIVADDFLTLIDALRIHDVTEAWHNLTATKKSIYSPRDNFVQAINELFFRKTLAINPGNEPVFTTEDGVVLPLMSLSSGEKQMFILLGETLLQRKRTCVYMADEPELSLHIDWQLSLVPNLKSINPNAQIIFATHSPDIVGAFGDEAFNLEDY